MKIEIYFSSSFTSVKSAIHKVTSIGDKFHKIDEDSKTTVKKMITDGWRLAHAIKTSQSAQFESFNFLLIFEKD
jgi:hypothetical protein